MQVDILTIFPGYFTCSLGEGLLKIAQDKGYARLRAIDIRDYTEDRHRQVDDCPYGGGPGMVMKPEPIFKALTDILGPKEGWRRRATIVILTPRGRRFDQSLAKRLAKISRLVVICGHYEGIDERVHEIADLELSVGDYVLSGGEPAALIVTDAIVRLLPGVVGKAESLADESFESGLLEYPQYTRPAEFYGRRVPDVLMSGDHGRIAVWRHREAIRKTWRERPDLLDKLRLSSDDEDYLLSLKERTDEGEHGNGTG